MAGSSSFRRHTDGKIAQRSGWRPGLIVPGAVPVYNVSILRNRFKGSVFPGRRTNRFWMKAPKVACAEGFSGKRSWRKGVKKPARLEEECMKKQYDVAAYIWPAYTGDEPRTRIFWPEGMGEWQSVKAAQAKFPGHQWPRKPLWGYVNEADP